MKVLQSVTTTAGMGGPMACMVSDKTYTRFVAVAAERGIDISALFDVAMATVPPGFPANEERILGWLDTL